MGKPKLAVHRQCPAQPLCRPSGEMDRRARRQSGKVDIELLDLKDYPLPFFEEAVSPA